MDLWRLIPCAWSEHPSGWTYGGLPLTIAAAPGQNTPQGGHVAAYADAEEGPLMSTLSAPWLCRRGGGERAGDVWTGGHITAHASLCLLSLYLRACAVAL